MARSPAIVYKIIWLIVKNVLCSRGSKSIGEKEKWRKAGANEHPGINGMPYVYFYIYHEVHNALQEDTLHIQHSTLPTPTNFVHRFLKQQKTPIFAKNHRAPRKRKIERPEVDQRMTLKYITVRGVDVVYPG